MGSDAKHRLQDDSPSSSETIRQFVLASFDAYFESLEDAPVGELHELFLNAFERPFLQAVMTRAKHNQSRAADWLGLSRNTLRKKLEQYDLLGSS